MKKQFTALAALAAVAATAAPAPAQCDGTPGWSLVAPDTVPIGGTVDVDLFGPASEVGFFMVSLGDGPINSSYGTICLDFPLALSFLFTFDENGEFGVSGEIPCDPALIDLTLYMQFITCKPNKGISNQEVLTITEGLCDGDLCTFTQGGWGTDCSGNNPGCRRDQFFDSVFPTGLVIGDADGVDGDGEFALHFTSSAAVNAFLSADGTPGALDGDQTDPTSSSAGIFAGQLVAATLNLAFDDAGALDDCKARDEVKLGDLVFAGGVDSDLIGMTVRDVIALANLAISGNLGSGPFDLDGDTVGDVDFSDLSDALAVLNENFVDGTTNNGNLALP
jgi:hypothetical protein